MNDIDLGSAPDEDFNPFAGSEELLDDDADETSEESSEQSPVEADEKPPTPKPNKATKTSDDAAESGNLLENAVNAVEAKDAYHFKPYRKFRKGEVHRRLENDSRTRKMDMQYLMRNMRSDRTLGITSYDWGRCGFYSHSDFYTKSGGSEVDIFLCVENNKLYVPTESELFQYTEPLDA